MDNLYDDDKNIDSGESSQANAEEDLQIAPEEETEEPEFSDDEEPESSMEEKNKKLPFWLGVLVGVAAAALVIILFLIFTSTRINSSQSSENTSVVSDEADTKYLSKINTILTYINKYFLWPENIDEDAIIEGIADGVLDSLGDKYAVYYTPEEFSELVASVSGQYDGIGVSIIMNDDDQVEVYKVYEGSPAEAAGMQIGDIIVEAEGVSDFETLDDLVAVVKGEAGTTVSIVVERNGERIEMSMERAAIDMITVDYTMVTDDIGYIYLAEFDTITITQFNEALDSLYDQGMKALILDVRDNPGGDYDSVVAIADRVLPEGVIMTVKDRDGTVETENSDEANQIDIPMAVLINGNSASASEVFAGAIQDYGIATIIGEQSYGKGIVQSIFQLADGSGLKFTTREYYTPSGDSINGVGVTPDIEVSIPDEAYEDGIIEEDEDLQLQKALEVLEEQLK